MSKTFGVTLSVYVTAAYVPFNGLLDITPPVLMATSPIDETTHQSPSGIKEFAPSGLREWSECSGSFLVIATDAGQDALRAGVGTQMKFKVVTPGRVTSTDDILFNAIVEAVENDNFGLEGKDTQKFKLKPTGAAPVS
jgi:hypothetical protein